MKLFYWTVYCRNKEDQEFVIKVPTTFWYVLFLWIGNAKVLVKIQDNGVNVLSLYYESRLHKKRFNVVAHSASNDPSWDLKQLCTLMNQYKWKVSDEIRRNRKS